MEHYNKAVCSSVFRHCGELGRLVRSESLASASTMAEGLYLYDDNI